MAWAVHAIARETMLFAAVGFLIGGIDDLLIDAFYVMRRAWRFQARAAVLTLDTLPPPTRPGHIAVFVPAWDEVAVIEAMLESTLVRFEHDNYRIYVGCYPNDRPTVDAVARVAERDPRVRLVIGLRSGPTTKADCLNTLWRALARAEIADDARVKAVVLHDAEDLVHPAELRIFDSLIERYAVVQLPVLPLVKRGSRMVSGHYADEFSESHGKQLVVRAALGAGLPLAGVGCAMSRDALAQIAARRGGDPFDGLSLTEDYELGLHIADSGGTAALVRVRQAGGGPIVAVRAYFPATLDAAVRQKARWMTGIALAGWDRIGWRRGFNVGDHWMRLRDRRAPLAVLVLAAAYIGLVAWGLGGAIRLLGGPAPPELSAWMRSLLWINLMLLGWRLATRMLFTGTAYGLSEALWAAPRLVVGNAIALFAARRAIVQYVAMLRGAAPVWDKTTHEFPPDAAAIPIP